MIIIFSESEKVANISDVGGICPSETTIGRMGQGVPAGLNVLGKIAGKTLKKYKFLYELKDIY